MAGLQRAHALAVFYACFDVRAGGCNQSAQRGRIERGPGPQLYVPHVFSAALQQVCRVLQHCSVKESDVHVRCESVDVSEGDIAKAGYGTAVVEQLAHLVAAGAHHLKPFTCEGAWFTRMGAEPGFDGGVVLDGSIKA